MTAKRVLAGDAAMADLAAVVGEDAARLLARRFGGTLLYVPRTIGEHHPICAAIGRVSADALSAWAGLTTLTIPKQPERRARVHQLHEQGALTVAQIAVETAFTERHIYRMLRDHRNDRQPSLFDD